MLVATGECGAAGVRPGLLCYKKARRKGTGFSFQLALCLSWGDSSKAGVLLLPRGDKSKRGRACADGSLICSPRRAGEGR